MKHSYPWLTIAVKSYAATMDAGKLLLLADRSDCIDRTQAAIQDPGGSDLRQAPYCYNDALLQTGGQAG